MLQIYSNQNNIVLPQKQIHRPMKQNREPRKKCAHIQSSNLQKGTKNTKQKKNSLLNKWCWENCIVTCKRMKLDPYLTSYTKIDSTWIKALNIRLETEKLQGENIEEKLLDTDFGNDFLEMTPNSIDNKSKHK